MNPMKIDSDQPHVHKPDLVKWNWVTDRPYAYCVCGERLDHLDPYTFAPAFRAEWSRSGPEIDDVYTDDQAEAECGVSWIVDLRWGLVVFGLAYSVILLALWVFGR